MPVEISEVVMSIVRADIHVGEGEQPFEAIHFLYDDSNDTVVLRSEGFAIFFRNANQLETFLHSAFGALYDEKDKIRKAGLEALQEISTPA